MSLVQRVTKPAQLALCGIRAARYAPAGSSRCAYKEAREELRCRDAFAHFGVYHQVHIISEDAARAESLQLCIGHGEQLLKQIGRESGDAE